jgi:hypothetical protein
VTIASHFSHTGFSSNAILSLAGSPTGNIKLEMLPPYRARLLNYHGSPADA